MTNILIAYVYGEIMFNRRVNKLTILAARMAHYLQHGDVPDFVGAVSGTKQGANDRVLSFAQGMATACVERMEVMP